MKQRPDFMAADLLQQPRPVAQQVGVLCKPIDPAAGLDVQDVMRMCAAAAET